MKYTREQLKAILLLHFPSAVAIYEADLEQLHSYSDFVDRVLNELDSQIMECVAYYLPPGTYGAAEGMCCNGIRYGEDGDYTSLPHLPFDKLHNLKRCP